VPLRPARDIGLGDLRHGDGRLHARRCAGLLEEVLQCEGVHDGAQHAHVVRPPPVHAPLAELGSAEEVASSDDDRDLHTVHGRRDLLRHLAHDIRIDPQLAGPERLSRKLEQNAPASGCLIDHVSSNRRGVKTTWLERGRRKGPASRDAMRAPSCRYAPTLKRAKSVTVMPAFFATWATDSLLSFA
jgi:hypothetical protein